MDGSKGTRQCARTGTSRSATHAKHIRPRHQIATHKPAAALNRRAGAASWASNAQQSRTVAAAGVGLQANVVAEAERVEEGRVGVTRWAVAVTQHSVREHVRDVGELARAERLRGGNGARCSGGPARARCRGGAGFINVSAATTNGGLLKSQKKARKRAPFQILAGREGDSRWAVTRACAGRCDGSTDPSSHSDHAPVGATTGAWRARPPRQSGTRRARRRALRWARPPRQLGTRWAGNVAVASGASVGTVAGSAVGRAPRRARGERGNEQKLRRRGPRRCHGCCERRRGEAERRGGGGAGRGGAGRGGAGADRGCSVPAGA